MEEYYNNYYIVLDGQGCIIDGWSDGPHPERSPSEGICINSKGEYQFRLFPDGEENPFLFDEQGIPLYRWDGEKVVVRTPEEIDADQNVPEPLLEHVPEPTAESLIRVLRAMAPSLPLNVAVEAPGLYPEWKAGIAYGGTDQPSLVSRMVNNRPLLFKCQTPHTSQEDWTPENTPSLWFQVVKEGTGTYNDPYIITSNLAKQYYSGKYYRENEVLYLCNRDSEIPLAYPPSQLVGHYFEVIT